LRIARPGDGAGGWYCREADLERSYEHCFELGRQPSYAEGKVEFCGRSQEQREAFEFAQERQEKVDGAGTAED
jgi:hypothetical protein